MLVDIGHNHFVILKLAEMASDQAGFPAALHPVTNTSSGLTILSDPFYDIIFKQVGIVGGRGDVDGDEVNLTRWELFSVKIAPFVAWLFCIGGVLINSKVTNFL